MIEIKFTVLYPIENERDESLQGLLCTEFLGTEHGVIKAKDVDRVRFDFIDVITLRFATTMIMYGQAIASVVCVHLANMWKVDKTRPLKPIRELA